MADVERVRVPVAEHSCGGERIVREGDSKALRETLRASIYDHCPTRAVRPNGYGVQRHAGLIGNTPAHLLASVCQKPWIWRRSGVSAATPC